MSVQSIPLHSIPGQLMVGGEFTVIAGAAHNRFTTIDAIPRKYLARFHLTGALDQSFADRPITGSM
jgi:hypothetical protein